MEYVLRAAIESDKPFLFDLHVITMRPHIENTWGWDDAWQRKDFDERFARCTVSIIEVSGERVGALWLERHPHALYVTDFQVAPAWQRRGIGTAVLTELTTGASSVSLDVELAVLPANVDARRLYERLGFRETRRAAPFVYMTHQARIDLRRVGIHEEAARTLIAALNAELLGQYPEPGATHFRLDDEEVTGGRGAFFVAYAGGAPVACGAVRLIDAQTAEIKRMYAVPSVRGRGVGHRMLTGLEAEAKALGATRLVLETGERARAALALYTRAGFVRIPCFGEYAHSPLSVCMAKDL